MVWVDGTMDHEADDGERDHGLGDLWQVLVVPGQPAPASEPAERAFRNPPARQKDRVLRFPWTQGCSTLSNDGE